MDDFMSVIRYTPPKQEFKSKFRWHGDTAEEAYAKGVVGSMKEFWEFRGQHLNTVKELFNNASSLSHESIEELLHNSRQNNSWSDSAVIAGQNVYAMKEKWQELDNIVKGRVDGNVYSYDTETLGDFDNPNSKFKYVTEFGIAKQTYESGIHINSGIENVSLAFGIDDDHYYMYKEVVDKITKGQNLTKEEEVIAKRAAAYAGDFSERFRMANTEEQAFLKGMGFKNPDVLLAVKLSQDTSYKDPEAVLSGLNNLKLAGETASLNSGIGKKTFQRAVELLGDAYSDENSVITVYNGTYDVNVINSTLNKFKIDSPKLSKSQNLDIMNVIRSASAARGQSVPEYVQSISRAKGERFANGLATGGTLEDVIKSLGLTGEFHNAGSDAANTATIASITNFFTEGRSLTGQIANKSIVEEALMASNEYSLGRKISVGDTVLFKKDARLNVNTGDFGTIGDKVVNPTYVSTTNRYWKINDIKRMDIPDTDGKTKNKYVVDFKNASFEGLDRPEVHAVKTFDLAEDVQNFLLTNTVGATGVTQKEINDQQRLMDYDLGRRQWDKLWDTKSIAITQSTGQTVGGFNDLVRFNTFHNEFMRMAEEAKNVDKNFPMPNTKNMIYSTYDTILEDAAKRTGMNAYDVNNYKYMFSKFYNEGGLIDNIISDVSSMEGFNNLQKTRIASKMYDTFNEAISPGSKIGSHVTVLSNIAEEERGIQALNDINYMSIMSPDGKVKSINISDTSRGTSDLMNAFKGDSDVQAIDNMIGVMESVIERGDLQTKKDLRRIIGDAKDYARGNNGAQKFQIASMFSSALNRNLDISNSDGMNPSVYGKYVDFVNKVGSDPMFGEEDSSIKRLQKFFSMSDADKNEFMENSGTYIRNINKEIAYAVNAKTLPGQISLAEKTSKFRNGVINYMDSRGNVNEVSVNEAMKKSWYKNIQEAMNNAAKDLSTVERGVLFPRVGLSIKDTELTELSKQIAAGLNYDKLNGQDYQESIKTISKILIHKDGNDPSRSYGLLNVPDHQTVVFRPNSINGDTFFVTSPQKNFSKVYDTMRDLSEKASGMTSKEISEALVDSNAGVLTFKKLNVRELFGNQYSTSVSIGKNNQEKFLAKSVTSYIGNKGEDVGRIYADIESGEIQMLHSYRKIGASDYIPKLLEGNYKEATRVAKKPIDAIIAENQGAVGQQTVLIGDKAMKKVIPNLADMTSANVVSIKGIVDLIPEMVNLDPENTTLQTLLNPFVPKERYGNNWTLNRETAAAAVNSFGFKEFFYKHITAPVKDDYVFVANKISQTTVEKAFGRKTIFEVLNSVVLGNGKDNLLHHGGKSLPGILQMLSENPYIFGALKENQVEDWKISLYNPLFFNEGSMFDAFARPVNMQQLTLKYFDPFAEGNKGLFESEQIAKVGSIVQSNQEFIESALRKTHEDGEINQRFSERKIMTYIKQSDDLDIANAFAKFDGNGETLKQRIFTSLKKGKETYDASLRSTVNALDDNTLDALYGLMKNEMATNYEGAFLMRPSIWNNDFFRIPDIRNVNMPEILKDFRGSDQLKNSILERLESNPVVKAGDVIGKVGDREFTWNGESGTILNPDEFLETGTASVLPLKRAIGDAKVIAGNEKAMAHSISYDLYDENSKIAQLFPNLSNKVRNGSMSFVEAKGKIDTYTDLLMSGIFGSKTGVVANMGVYKHLSGGMVYNSKLNVILNEASKTGNVGKMQNLIEELNNNGFKDWNFKIGYDDNKNYKKPKPVFTYDISEMVRDNKSNGYITELMNLENSIREGKIGTKEFQRNVIRELDQLEKTNTVLTSLGRALNQEKKGDNLKLNSRLKNAGSLLDDMLTDPVVGYNAFENGEMYSDVLREYMLNNVYGIEGTIKTGAQVSNFKDKEIALSVLRSMETSMKYMDNAKDIANAQSVVSVPFSDLNIPKSGAGIGELEMSIFGINGSPSEFLQRAAITNGNKDASKVNILNLALPNGLTVSMPSLTKGQEGKALKNVLIPLQNIRVTNEKGGFYTKSQTDVVHFLNTIQKYNDGLNTGKDIMKLRANVQNAFEDMYSSIQYDLGTNSGSMYSGLIEKVAVPNSGQFSAQKIDSPLLKAMIEPNEAWGGRNLKEEYDRIRFNGITENMSYSDRQVKLLQNLEKANDFQKEVMSEYAARVRGGEVMEMLSGNKYITKGTRLVDGKLVEMDMYDNVTTISRGGLKKLGLNNAGIGTDIYKDLTATGELTKKVSNGWIGGISKESALDQFIEAFNSQEGEIITRENANKFINKSTMYKFKYNTEVNGKTTTKTGYIDFDEAIEQLRSKGKAAEFNGISIRDLNKSVKDAYVDISSQRRKNKGNAESIENAFTFLREKYLSEVGVVGLDLRDPTFFPGSVLYPTLKLDASLSSDSEVVISTPFGAFAQNLDLDGDNKTLAAFLSNTSRSMNKDDKYSQAIWGMHNMLNTRNNELLAQLIEKHKFADDINNPLLYTVSMIKTMSPDIYEKMKENGFQPDDVWNGVQEYSEKYGNMLTNLNALSTATKAKANKPGIGSFSIPNFRVRTIMEDIRGTEFMNDNIWQRTLRDLSAFTENGGVLGLLTYTEQTGIDVKHDTFSDYIAETPMWNAGMNKLFRDIEGETPEVAKIRSNAAISEMLRAAGPKLSKDPEYVTNKKNLADAEYILRKTREELGIELDNLRAQGKELAQAVGKKAEKELVDSQITRLEYLSQIRSLYDLSQLDIAKKMYSANLVGENKSIQGAIRQREVISQLRDNFSDILGKSSSTDSAALNSIKSEILPSVGLDPFNDIFITKKGGQGYVFQGYSDDKAYAVFRGINLASTMANKSASLRKKDFVNIPLTGDIDEALNSRFLNTKLGLSNIIRFKISDEVNGAQEMIDQAAKELAAEELTRGMTYPYEIVSQSKGRSVTARESLLKYNPDIEELIESNSKKIPKEYINENIIGRQKYRIMGGIQSVLPSEETVQLINGYLNVANNLYGNVESKNLIKQLNYEMINNYKNPDPEKTMDGILKFLKRKPGLNNDYLDDKIKNSTTRIIKAFKDNDSFGIDSFKFLQKYGSYRNDLYDTNSIEKMLGGMNDELLNEKLGLNALVVAQREQELHGFIKNQNMMDSIFNLKAEQVGERQIAFGKYLGYSIEDLSLKDIDFIKNEISGIGEEDSLKYYAASIAEKSINDYNNSNDYTMRLKTDAPIKGIVPEDVINFIPDETSTSGFSSDNIKESFKKMKKKVINEEAVDSLTGRLKGKLQGIGEAGGKAFAYGTMALFAIGLANEVLRKDEDKSPLIAKNGGSAQGFSTSSGRVSKSSGDKVIYTDSSSGLSYKVKAKTARYIRDSDNAIPFSGAMNARLQVQSERDMTGVNQNWLQERMSDIF